MLGIILTVLYILSCLVLIMFVLLQPGKSDASAVFGGGVNSAAFGPRGTQTVLAKITITAAISFFLIAFLFSIPGLFDKRSLGEGVGPAEQAPAAPVVPAAPDTPTGSSGAAQPPSEPPVTPAAPAEQGAGSTAKPAASKDASKPATKDAAKAGTEKKN
ncbi:MAG TPA: preprotein translocase subunit SecG [Blastocatellia bacterium]|nr:preprotein translocase subunit SecG [Blastocatellia bacterium]